MLFRVAFPHGRQFTNDRNSALRATSRLSFVVSWQNLFRPLLLCTAATPVCVGLALLLHPLPSVVTWLGTAGLLSGIVAFGFLLNADRRMRELEEARRLAAERERGARERLELLARASLALEEAVASLPGSGVGCILRTIADQARRLACAEFAIIEIEHDSPGTTSWGCGPRDLSASSGPAPASAAVLRKACGIGGVFRLEGLASSSDFAAFQENGRLHSLLGMPISFRGRRIGFLVVGNRAETARFDEDDEDTVRMLAGRAGIALETARLYNRAALEKAFLEGVVDEMPDGITLVDARGRVIAHNRAARRMTGRLPEQSDAHGNSILFDAYSTGGEPLPWSDLPVFAACERGERTLRREIVLRQGERQIPVLASAVPIVDDRRQRVGAVAVYQDITMIRSLEQMRDEWASLIAHDLRQPIGTVILTADLLRQRRIAVTDGDVKALDRLEAAASRLSTMIDDLLDVSRLDARNLSLSLQVVELEDLLLDSADRLSSQTGAAIRVVFDRTVPRVLADPGRLDQVICNLLSNAVKYGTKGAPVVVEAKATEDGVAVTVTNRGGGIEPHEIPRLFARFHRTDAARKGATPGIGLGLYICKGLIEAHGGTISVSSIPGDRTDFTFVLPVSGKKSEACEPA